MCACLGSAAAVVMVRLLGLYWLPSSWRACLGSAGCRRAMAARARRQADACLLITRKLSQCAVQGMDADVESKQTLSSAPPPPPPSSPKTTFESRTH
ncbi:hypothetical protein CYMTET_45129 [Cymbomonas tetramitiformis]|uniref:Uncharacterized protein n=1 Tax=Cymbomonas tetramitiformis TaxID=36881 RepID=A0AAE0C0M2_9CHLO|nr:hypothetical protein CYMTET_45129 [Cymbomonas tetramitiformis]